MSGCSLCYFEINRFLSRMHVCLFVRRNWIWLRGDIVQGDIDREILSWGILSRGILTGRYCPGGYCPGGYWLGDIDREILSWGILSWGCCPEGYWRGILPSTKLVTSSPKIGPRLASVSTNLYCFVLFYLFCLFFTFVWWRGWSAPGSAPAKHFGLKIQIV